MNAQTGKVGRLEALLSRIRSRARAPHPSWAVLAKDRAPNDDVARPLPMPAPVPVSDVAPTHPRRERPPELTPSPPPWAAKTPQKQAEKPITTPAPMQMMPTPTPSKPIPRAKTLLMGASPMARSPSSFPPAMEPAPTPAPPTPAPIEDTAPHDAPTKRRRAEPLLQRLAASPSAPVEVSAETPAPVEEQPVAQDRIVRISSPPMAEAPAHTPAPAPAVAFAAAPAPAPADSAAHLPPLPPAIPVPTASPPSTRMPPSSPQPQGKGWWLAIVVFLLFAAGLIAAHHFGFLPLRR